MIRAFLHSGTRRFAKQFGYNARYQHDIIDTDWGAGARLALFQVISNYAGPRSAHHIRMGALVGSAVEGDCGPCAQLTVDMALAYGARAADIQIALNGAPEAAGDFGLGYQFAWAAIRGDDTLDDLRARIEAVHGPRAVIAASFAAAFARTYPVIKRGTGHGKLCQRLDVNGTSITLTHPTAA
ncbi:hypothetical protein [uncultured Tateyamaria sp.]|uniref:hypothetical protein n=1 Tax=uncultured Tateyamaria sp. TaxID=455651 RepID=UPI00260B9C8E|nr:hypothetical protein [uncultured Tateyamaria sp.]